MRALVLESEGAMPVLKDVPKPEPGKTEVLVKVSAAGVNYADTMVRRGFYLQKPAFPYIPGIEFSGIAEAVGAAVKHVKPGDRVMCTGDHGFAEYTVAPAGTVMLAPAKFTDEQAAAFPVVFMTALAMLRLSTCARKGETILVHAAAGGVGTASIQLAKHLGLHVIATASTDEKLETAARLGADVTINYSREDFVQPVLDATRGRGADIIFESIGGDFIERDIRAAAPFGRIVVFGMASGSAAPPDIAAMFRNSVSVAVFWLFTLMRHSELLAPVIRELLDLVDKGTITPVISRIYPLEKAEEAFVALESRRTIGKLVLKP